MEVKPLLVNDFTKHAAYGAGGYVVLRSCSTVAVRGSIWCWRKASNLFSGAKDKTVQVAAQVAEAVVPQQTVAEAVGAAVSAPSNEAPAPAPEAKKGKKS